MGTVYATTKIFHFPRKLDDISAGRVTPPLHVRLKPTNRCTHRCSYCCYRNDKLYLSEGMDERDEIPVEKMREIVADLIAMQVRAVTFSGGGEPLCYAHITSAIETLVDGGVKVAMLTHGGLLRGDVAELLARRAAWVRVSMDAADRKSYAQQRHVPLEEFDRVCDNIHAFSALPERRCVLGINLIVTAENAAQVRAFLELAKDLGADHVKVSNAVVSTDPDENAAYQAPFYDTVKQQIADSRVTLTDARFSIIDKVHLPDSRHEGFEKHYRWCPSAQFLTVVAADQNVYTCQDKAYTKAGWLGSIKDCSFRELWSSPELAERLRALDPQRDCLHHCVAHGKNLMLLDYFEADQDHLDFV
jgi:MoaA/NifB/PqqE/SkfB family radical SAM enzyme